MRKILRKICIYALLIFVFSACFHVSDVKGAGVDSAPLTSSQTAKNGMVRVYLSSIGSLNRLDITVAGSYSVSGSSSFNLINGERIAVSMDSSTGSLTLQRGGAAFSMGREFTLRRHQTAGENGLKIAQTRQSSNLYPGDLYLRSVQSGNVFKLYAIVHVYMEYYLQGVVPYEMGDSANIEALKAQTVAARTYTLSKMEQRKSMTYDVVDTVNDQVYYGNSPTTINCTNAVNATKGIVLTYDGSLASTYYSASNGGQTESALNLWGMTNLPYLMVKTDPFDLLNVSSTARKINVYRDFSSPMQDSTLKSLLMKKAAAQFGGANTVPIVSIDDINPHTPYYSSPSELYTKLDFDLTVGAGGDEAHITVTFDIFSELEQQLGMGINASRNELWSVDKIGGNFVIYARRFGHGIGMSQRGAMQMGNMGYTYDQILGFYYPGCVRLQYVMTHTVLSDITSGSGSVLVQSENPAELTYGGTTATVSLPDKNGTLAIRYSPDNSGKVLTGVVNGALVQLLSTDGTWAKVKLGEIVGFVPAYCLVYSEIPTASIGQQPTDIKKWATVECSGTLNLRSGGSMDSPVMGKIPTGSILCVFDFSSGWAKVQYGAQSGYASGDFLVFSDSYPGSISEINGSVNVKAPTRGETVNLRSQPSTSGNVIAAMADGTPLTLLSMDSSWCTVVLNGTKGYVMTKYISASGSGIQEKIPLPSPVPENPMNEKTEEAVVYTVSSGLNFREKPSTSSGVMAVLPRGESVTVVSRGSEWTQIRYAGISGYVKTEYLRFSMASNQAGTAMYVVTPGGPLNMRSNPSIGSAVLVQIPEGAQVSVFASASGWSTAKYGSVNGYVMSKFLSNSAPVLSSPSSSDYAMVATQSGGLNLRETASADSRVLAVIPQGTALTVISRENGWCSVSYAGKNGFVMERFLSFGGNPPESTSIPSQLSSEKYQVVVSTSGGGLNLREKPDSDSRVMTIIPNGTVLMVSKVSSGWLSTEYGGSKGCIMEKFTKKYTDTATSSSAAVSTAPDKTMYVSAKGGVNLRSEPSASSQLLTVIPQGAQVSAKDMGEWCQVEYAGISGYAMKKYMSDNSGSDKSGGVCTISSFGRAVSLFASPESAGEILCHIPDGSQVTVMKTSAQWCQVQWNDITGYIETSSIPEIASQYAKEQ